jgi:predicted ATPase
VSDAKGGGLGDAQAQRLDAAAQHDVKPLPIAGLTDEDWRAPTGRPQSRERMIRHVELKNFKSFRDLSLDLKERNVLVGPNMSGKTNLLLAFRFLTQMVSPYAGGHGLLNALASLGGFQEILWRGHNSSEPPARSISLALSGDFKRTRSMREPEFERWNYVLELESNEGGAVVKEETLTIASSRGTHDLITTGIDKVRFIIDPTQGTLAKVLDATRSALEFELPQWEGNEYRQMFASFYFFTLNPREMKQPNLATTTNVLTETGNNLSAWLMTIEKTAPESFQKIKIAVKNSLGVTNLYTPQGQAVVWLISEEQNVRNLPVFQMSDGQVCFIALVSLIFSPFEAPLFCIEEPENHMHPKLLETLVGLLDQSRRALGDKAAQLLVTTHSLQLVDKLNLEDLILFYRRGGESLHMRPERNTRLRELLADEHMGLGELYYSGALRDGQ